MSLMEQKVQQYKDEAAGLSGILPDVAQAYNQFTAQCFEAGELDGQTKQLIALGVALFANNEICTYYHVQEARALGASELQIMETAAVAAAAASGHALSQGVIRVQGALGLGAQSGQVGEGVESGHSAAEGQTTSELFASQQGLHNGKLHSMVEPDVILLSEHRRGPSRHLLSYLDDAEFGEELAAPGMSIPGGSAVSPSY